MSWQGNIESHQHFQAIIFLHQPTVLKDIWKPQFLGFMGLNTNLFGNIINTYPFEDRNGRICRLILAHVLIKMKCCLFPFILSSYHRRGRGHYIRAIKMIDGKASILYIMIVKYLVNCWDNFEPEARMTLNFKHLPTDQT